jgi:integrase
VATIRQYQTKKGTRWEALIYLGRHPDTGRSRFTSQAFSREKEAKAWATEQEGQRNKGILGPTTVAKQPLSLYLTETWLPTYRTQVRSTYNTEKTLGKWILRPRPDTPFLGKVAIDKLEVTSFDRLYVAMAAQGIGTRGISHLHGILVKAFNDAVKKNLLARNPAKGATIPRAESQSEIKDEHDEEEAEVEYLSPEQTMGFLKVAKADRLSALWHVLLDGGLRPGEAYALLWRNVDVEQRLVKVRATLTRVGVKKEVGGDGWKRTKPKTKSSIRAVPLSQATIAELRRWKRRQAEERLLAGPEWQDHDFVFTTEVGSPLGNNVGRAWVRLLAAADGGKGDLGTWGPEPKKPRSGPTPQRKFTPRFVQYVLRHTCATLALLDGIDLLTVSRRLGHKNTGITSTFYGHVAAEHSGACADSFERLAAMVGSA